ncbi:MAG: DUF2794 domain-containing protein [Hyphomicrobiales bacterium]|nr:DUF2794 domain-containing protein [Hyphomicrobiales bacterium]
MREARLAEEEPRSAGADGALVLAFAPKAPPSARREHPTKPAQPARPVPPIVGFERGELRAILDLYARKVAEGAWRDYAIDFGREAATFSVFRRASEGPLYRIEKAPKLARAQGAYSVVAATGRILKRGHDLARVLAVLDPRLAVVR